MLLYSHFKTFFSEETFSSVSTQISMRCEGDFKSDSFGGITHQSSLSTLSLLKLLEICFLEAPYNYVPQNICISKLGV